MKTLNNKQRAAWKSIATDKKHPWYSLGVQALLKDEQQKKIKKLFKSLKPK